MSLGEKKTGADQNPVGKRSDTDKNLLLSQIHCCYLKIPAMPAHHQDSLHFLDTWATFETRPTTLSSTWHNRQLTNSCPHLVWVSLFNNPCLTQPKMWTMNVSNQKCWMLLPNISRPLLLPFPMNVCLKHSFWNWQPHLHVTFSDSI